MRQDIIGGLKNALEHGATLDQAIVSFISAGYKEEEVREAAKSLENGVSMSMPPAVVKPTPTQNLPQNNQQTQPRILPAITQPPQPPQIPQYQVPRYPPQPTFQQPIQQPLTQYPSTMPQQYPSAQQYLPYTVPHHDSKFLIILLSIILILSIGALALSIIFKPEITEFFNTLLS